LLCLAVSKSHHGAGNHLGIELVMGCHMVKRGRLWVFAAKPLIFNPYSAMSAQIKAAGNAIGEHFDGVEYLLGKGRQIKEAVYDSDIEKALHRSLATSRLMGFQDAAKYSKANMPALYGREIASRASKRAAWVNKKMLKTSSKVLKNTPDSEFVLSKDRAIAAAQYETGRSYFKGVKDAFQGTGWGKEWITSEAESCSDCLDNEDMGPIGVDEDFDSGDSYPPSHLNCPCVVSMVRL